MDSLTENKCAVESADLSNDFTNECDVEDVKYSATGNNFINTFVDVSKTPEDLGNELLSEIHPVNADPLLTESDKCDRTDMAESTAKDTNQCSNSFNSDIKRRRMRLSFCSRNCYLKITEEDQKRTFETFTQKNTFHSKWNFVNSLTEIKLNPNGSRKLTKFYLNTDNGRQTVCKMCFLSVLGISIRLLNVFLEGKARKMNCQFDEENLKNKDLKRNSSNTSYENKDVSEVPESTEVQSDNPLRNVDSSIKDTNCHSIVFENVDDISDQKRNEITAVNINKEPKSINVKQKDVTQNSNLKEMKMQEKQNKSDFKTVELDFETKDDEKKRKRKRPNIISTFINNYVIECSCKELNLSKNISSFEEAISEKEATNKDTSSISKVDVDLNLDSKVKTDKDDNLFTEICIAKEVIGYDNNKPEDIKIKDEELFHKTPEKDSDLETENENIRYSVPKSNLPDLVDGSEDDSTDRDSFFSDINLFQERRNKVTNVTELEKNKNEQNLLSVQHRANVLYELQENVGTGDIKQEEIQENENEQQKYTSTNSPLFETKFINCKHLTVFNMTNDIVIPSTTINSSVDKLTTDFDVLFKTSQNLEENSVNEEHSLLSNNDHVSVDQTKKVESKLNDLSDSLEGVESILINECNSRSVHDTDSRNIIKVLQRKHTCQGCKYLNNLKLSQGYTRLCKCNNNCHLKVKEEDQKHIFETYWQAATVNSRQKFINDMTEIVAVNFPPRKVPRVRSKRYNTTFYFIINDCKQKVCKACFRTVLNESLNFINNVLKKKWKAECESKKIEGKQNNISKNDVILNKKDDEVPNEVFNIETICTENHCYAEGFNLDDILNNIAISDSEENKVSEVKLNEVTLPSSGNYFTTEIDTSLSYDFTKVVSQINSNDLDNKGDNIDARDELKIANPEKVLEGETLKEILKVEKQESTAVPADASIINKEENLEYDNLEAKNKKQCEKKSINLSGFENSAVEISQEKSSNEASLLLTNDQSSIKLKVDEMNDNTSITDLNCLNYAKYSPTEYQLKRKWEILGPCRNKCHLKIKENDRKRIYSSYWQEGTFESRFAFIVNMTESSIKPGGLRVYNKFYLNTENGRQRICKSCFCLILDISNKFISAVLDQKCRELNKIKDKKEITKTLDLMAEYSNADYGKDCLANISERNISESHALSNDNLLSTKLVDLNQTRKIETKEINKSAEMRIKESENITALSKEDGYSNLALNQGDTSLSSLNSKLKGIVKEENSNFYINNSVIKEEVEFENDLNFEDQKDGESPEEICDNTFQDKELYMIYKDEKERTVEVEEEVVDIKDNILEDSRLKEHLNQINKLSINGHLHSSKVINQCAKLEPKVEISSTIMNKIQSPTGKQCQQSQKVEIKEKQKNIPIKNRKSYSTHKQSRVKGQTEIKNRKKKNVRYISNHLEGSSVRLLRSKTKALNCIEKHFHDTKLHEETQMVINQYISKMLKVGNETQVSGVSCINNKQKNPIDLFSDGSKVPKPTEAETKIVEEHIKKFPLCESYHFNGQNSEKYLPMGLTIKVMYDLYKNEVSNPVSIVWYQKILGHANLNFKLAFSTKCDDCNTAAVQYRLSKDPSEKSKINRHRTAHLIDSEEANNSKSQDEKAAKCTNSLLVCSFGFQQSLPTPFLSEPSTFYNQRLWTYNLTVQNQGKSQIKKCRKYFMWHEAVGKRSANEIASCLYQYLQHLPSNIKFVIFYSTSCNNECRSKALLTMFSYLIANHKTLTTVEHKFLISGHSQIEENLGNNLTEEIMKRYQGKIQEPKDWYRAFESYNEVDDASPITIMTPEIFYNFDNMREDLLEGNEPFIEQDVKWLRYTKDGIFYKKSWSTTASFQVLNLKGSCVSNDFIKQELRNLECIPVTQKKKRDLLDLLPFMKPEVKSFYEELSEQNFQKKDININVDSIFDIEKESIPLSPSLKRKFEENDEKESEDVSKKICIVKQEKLDGKISKIALPFETIIVKEEKINKC